MAPMMAHSFRSRVTGSAFPVPATRRLGFYREGLRATARHESRPALAVGAPNHAHSVEQWTVSAMVGALTERQSHTLHPGSGCGGIARLVVPRLLLQSAATAVPCR